MRKRGLYFLFTLYLMFTNVGNSYAVTIETVRGFSFRIYDVKSNDYSYPSFRLTIKTPDGKIIGWDESKNKWTGTIDAEESGLKTTPFWYPDPDQQCTSNVEHVTMVMNLSPEIRAGYGMNTALYCRNVETGENIFISSGYDGGITGAQDGRYEILIIPYKYAVVELCYSFGVRNMEPVNILCTDNNYQKNLLITPNNQQKIEIFYDYIKPAENKIQKIVTPTLLVDEWEGCYKVGLIKNQGIYNSINKKLLQAKEKYEAGDIKTSTNIKNAIINEINAQYNKGITAQCADILLEDLGN